MSTALEQSGGKAGEILDLAERHVRTVGFNGFSFRDLANEAGIKSASVHYHFPTKEKLGAAVARRYADRFMGTIGDPQNSKKAPAALIEVFVGEFRGALHKDGRMCLFCLLGAEFSALPPEVRAEVTRFYRDSTRWLAEVLGRIANGKKPAAADLETQARAIIACLEGAMLVARSSDKLSIFDEIVAYMKSTSAIPA